MSTFRSSLHRTLRRQQHRINGHSRPQFYRQFHASKHLDVVKPFLLADIGEGITECQLIQWFVQPGARVEQFDKICEVQSDKASVEITSPFDGVIQKLHYEPDDMAITGKPLVDIDIQGEISDADAAKLGNGGGGDSGGTDAMSGQQEESTSPTQKQREGVDEYSLGAMHTSEPSFTPTRDTQQQQDQHASRESTSDKGSLATPAVRRLIKENNLRIEDVRGSGKDGRVLKEDVQQHISRTGSEQPSTPATPSLPSATVREDRKVPLTAVQNQMFKTMTRSLNIPHFLYSSTADMTALTGLRKKLNANAASEDKLTHLAFIMKAISLSIQRHPLLNATLHTKDSQKPELTYRGSHNFGIAIDSPSGLLVPVIKNVQDLNIMEIATSMRQLSEKARSGKLTTADFKDATFTVSNIGSIGGGVVAPVISEPQVAIVGIGRSKVVPAFGENGELMRKEELVFSWSADHRVVDGAECARCAERVRGLLEDPSSMLIELR